MRITLTAVLAAGLALSACGGGQTDTTGQEESLANDLQPAAPSPGDANGMNAAAPTPGVTANSAQEYVTLVGASDLFEIESARLALQKGQDQEVKALAQAILTDHERSTSQLRTAAAQATPPIEVAPAMNAEQQSDLRALQAAAGPAFDRLYVGQQVQAHEQALGLVTAYAGAGDSAPLRQHASTVAGPIQQHLSRARTLAERTARP